VFYFQVHQPYRLKRLNFFDILHQKEFFDEGLNRAVIDKVSNKCYVPTTTLLLRLINKFEGYFRIAFSISGVMIEQLKKYRPDVLDLFVKLAKTGCVEFIGETYYHSLSYLYDPDEFEEQVDKHFNLIQNEFGFSPVVFRNTELIYENRLSDLLTRFSNYKVILTEGADKILGWRSPLFPYRTHNDKHYLLLKYYSLSDDIAFRFSDKGWDEWPLTADKILHWIEQLSLKESKGKNLYLNLFMDFETFGEHQWEDTGIFKFMEYLPEKVLSNKYLAFGWPSDIIEGYQYPAEKLSVDYPVSWADMERDLSAWLSNSIQHNAAETLYSLLKKVRKNGKPPLLMETLRKLSTSDHFYYMCTKYFQDGDVHKYFSPYDSPESAYLYFLYALTGIEEQHNLV
jgi:alpha-amylase